MKSFLLLKLVNVDFLFFLLFFFAQLTRCSEMKATIFIIKSMTDRVCQLFSLYHVLTNNRIVGVQFNVSKMSRSFLNERNKKVGQSEMHRNKSILVFSMTVACCRWKTTRMMFMCLMFMCWWKRFNWFKLKSGIKSNIIIFNTFVSIFEYYST